MHVQLWLFVVFFTYLYTVLKKILFLYYLFRNDIVDALLEVRTNNNGFLSGLSINAIVEMASLALRKDTGQYKKK